MTTKTKIILLVLLLLGIISAGILYYNRHKIINKLKVYYRTYLSTNSANCPCCPNLFTDNVATHEKAYTSGEGITPQKNDAGLLKLLKQKKLIEIRSNKYYIIRKMDYAKPYILPKGKKFIDALATLYAEKCSQERIEYIPFTITSITRTIDSVNELTNSNPNGIKNSAHLKGKTFDVSYTAFKEKSKQKSLFIKSLKEMRSKKRCYVKFERNGCLHITVR